MQLRVLFLLCVVALAPVRSSFAQASSANAPQPVSAFDPLALSPSDAALRTPITLDANRMPLPDFARRLSDATHITLTLPPELNGRRITAHLEQQPLSETLRSLSGLYGLEWQRVTRGWSARVAASELERTLLQGGDLNEWSGRIGSREELKAIASKTLAAVPRAFLESEKGVALSQVPGLTEELRGNRQMNTSLSLLQSWGASSPFLLRASVLRVRLPYDPRPDAPAPVPHFVVANALGQPLADLGAMVVPTAPPAARR